MNRTAAALALLVACSHDWDKLDPRLDGGAGGSSSPATSSGGTSGAGGQPTGAGGTGAAGAAGAGSQGGAGSTGPSQGGGGAGSCVEGCAAPTPLCDEDTGQCVECLTPLDCSAIELCAGGSCCVFPGDTCENDDDCCEGSCQPSGFCGFTPNCLGNGAACADDSQCCSDDCSGGSAMCEGFFE